MNTNVLRAPIALLLTIAIFLSLTLISGHTAIAQETLDGTITGEVTNVTTGEPVSGITVTLSAFTAEGQIGEFSVQAEEDGTFTFAGVDTGDGIVYAASVSYRGVLYSSGMIRFLESDTQTTTIEVYETTTDRTAVSVSSRGIVLNAIDPESGTATMLDITALEVDGDLTFVPGDTGRSVELPVPRNAGQPTLMPGFDFGTAFVENAIVFASSPLRPGGATATISYPVQYTGTSFSLDIQHVYPTEIFRVLIATDLGADADSITITGSGLTDEGVAQIGERSYHVWTASDIPNDSVVRVTFGDLPESQFEPNRLRTTEPAVLAGVALLAATVATVVMVRRKHIVPTEPDVEEAVTAGFVESRDELVIELQKLQDEFENGLIEESLYLTERRRLLERLRTVSRHLRNTPADDASDE